MSQPPSDICSRIPQAVCTTMVGVSGEIPLDDDIIEEESLVESEPESESDSDSELEPELKKQNTGFNGLSVYDKQKSLRAYIKMIVESDLDLNMFDRSSSFQDYVKCLNPKAKFNLVGIEEAVMKLFNEMKVKLQDVLLQLSSRASLSTDIWKPEYQTKCYCCLTCHYIDNDWVFNKKVIGYKVLYDESEVNDLSEIVKSQTMSWNIENNLFDIVIDDAVNSDDEVAFNLKEWFNLREALPLKGQLFPMYCSSHIINIIVQDGFEVIADLLRKFRDSITYSEAYCENFEKILSDMGLAGKYVPSDNLLRWNTTYNMLKKAVKVHLAFERLAELHPEDKYLPSKEEWKLGKVICDCLKVYYETKLQFSKAKYPTTNVSFKGIFYVYKSILKCESSEHDCVREMAYKMKEKLDTYWSKCSLMMSMGMIFDPRYKMVFVEYAYNVIYGSESQTYISKVLQSLSELYSSYEMHFSNVVAETDKDYESFLKQRLGDLQVNKSEIENYLEEELFPRDADESSFDILVWWKTYGIKYPTLARMARDILAVPGFTLPEKWAFNVEGRVIPENRVSLAPDIVEALTCIKDWLPPSKMMSGDDSDELIDE